VTYVTLPCQHLDLPGGEHLCLRWLVWRDDWIERTVFWPVSANGVDPGRGGFSGNNGNGGSMEDRDITARTLVEDIRDKVYAGDMGNVGEVGGNEKVATFSIPTDEGDTYLVAVWKAGEERDLIEHFREMGDHVAVATLTEMEATAR
jgi:hypothetical protein